MLSQEPKAASSVSVIPVVVRRIEDEDAGAAR